MMVILGLISLIFKIWEDLEIWEEIKATNSHSMAKIWVEWEEWVELIQAKYSKCLWEEKEDLEVILVVLAKEENLQIKHHKRKEENSVIHLLRDLISTVLEDQALGRLEGNLSKRVNRKNDFLI